MNTPTALTAGFLLGGATLLLTSAALEQDPPAPSAGDPPGWQQGRGWGWIWGAEDELGALNAMTDATRREALSLAREGRVYDLGVTFSRRSFVWPGHSPGEVMTFRSPEGIRRQGDHAFTLPDVNPAGVAWHSCAMFMSDNVATQIDALGHLAAGEDLHWYNGFTEAEHGGDFGLRKCDAAGIPPIINRAVLLDVPALLGVEALPGGFAILPEHVDACLERQGTELRPGDVVFARTGTLRYWAEDGADHEKLAEHNTAGLHLDTAKYLVEQRGALALGTDTAGVEVEPAPEGSDTFVPVHRYALIDQGVHLLEFHYLEDLSRDRVYEFCYVATTPKVAGTTAGFAMRPLALR